MWMRVWKGEKRVLKLKKRKTQEWQRVNERNWDEKNPSVKEKERARERERENDSSRRQSSPEVREYNKKKEKKEKKSEKKIKEIERTYNEASKKIKLNKSLLLFFFLFFLLPIVSPFPFSVFTSNLFTTIFNRTLQASSYCQTFRLFVELYYHSTTVYSLAPFFTIIKRLVWGSIRTFTTYSQPVYTWTLPTAFPILEQGERMVHNPRCGSRWDIRAASYVINRFSSRLSFFFTA